MLDLNLRFHGSCPKHPCYHPREGRGAIKGGCIYCEALCRVYRLERPFMDAVTEYQNLLDRYREKKLPRAKGRHREVVQPELFEMGSRR